MKRELFSVFDVDAVFLQYMNAWIEGKNIDSLKLHEKSGIKHGAI